MNKSLCVVLSSLLMTACATTSEHIKETSKMLTSQNQDFDFIANPYIPDTPHIKEYIGKWAMKEGLFKDIVHIEIKQDDSGNYLLFFEKNDNWNYHYNNVHWVDDNLHYQSFAYTANPKLLNVPYNHSTYYHILSPTQNTNEMTDSFFIDGERVDFIYYRKED